MLNALRAIDIPLISPSRSSYRFRRVGFALAAYTQAKMTETAFYIYLRALSEGERPARSPFASHDFRNLSATMLGVMPLAKMSHTFLFPRPAYAFAAHDLPGDPAEGELA
jgi:hypothetical protein